MKSLLLILLLCTNGWGTCDDVDGVSEKHYPPIAKLITELPVTPLSTENKELFTKFFHCIEAKYHQGFIDAISWILPPENKINPLEYYKLLMMAAYHRTPETARFAFLNAITTSQSTGNLADDIEKALGLEVVGDTINCKKSSQLHHDSEPLVLLPWTISEQFQGIPWTVSGITT